MHIAQICPKVWLRLSGLCQISSPFSPTNPFQFVGLWLQIQFQGRQQSAWSALEHGVCTFLPESVLRQSCKPAVEKEARTTPGVPVPPAVFAIFSSCMKVPCIVQSIFCIQVPLERAGPKPL